VIGLRVRVLPSHVANSELSRRLLDEFSFLVVRRIAEIRYGDAGRDEGAFA
jgi:hypothetical protein